MKSDVVDAELARIRRERKAREANSKADSKPSSETQWPDPHPLPDSLLPVAAFNLVSTLVMCAVPALEAGPSEERHNGNGSLMRVLPLALWHRGPDRELVNDAYTQSRVTHGHARSRLCCAL